MMKHVELDPTRTLAEQISETSTQPTILLNVFDVDRKDEEAFKKAWAEDAAFFKRQPGYISAQLHQGIAGSRMWMNYAVFENTAAFAATTRQAEFGPMRAGYPDSATARPHLFRRVHVPLICVGEI